MSAESVAALDGAVIETEAEPEAAPAVSLEEFLPDPAAKPAPRASPAALQGMRAARVTRVSGRAATIALRGAPSPIEAQIAPEVDPEIIADAAANGDSVLVELAEGEAPLVVGALQTRRPREIRLRAATVQIEGDKEILLRSGRGAIRIREDGDIEVVGSRISAASRGLFRIVGRMLRLN
jgi:hypothetical protein